ncbi:MAG TPA: hypothetical protein DG577_07435 [Firmicutes bacterium]|jgi:serine/threonine protein kinase|nr:hypothetical protein [Bacillota bacterium]
MANKICYNCFRIKGDYEVCPFCGWLDNTEPEQAYHLRPGTILGGRYLIGTVLGFGGFGTTYKVWDSQLASIVAIKEFYPSGLVSRVPGEKQVVVFSGEKRDNYQVALSRFLDEARNMAKFSKHPNIVNVLDYFEENGTAYIVMEYLNGMSLSEFLVKQGNKLDVDTCLSIIGPTMDALIAIHNQGIIHRDIHPGNIFITANNQIKIIDFGAAKFSTGDVEKTLTVVVTQGYASPEQYRSKSKQGPWIDVYGLGATFYKMVTGQLPDEAVDRQVEDTLKRPSQLGIKIESYLEKAIMKAMAIKTELRFSKMEQFRDAVFNNKVVDFPEVELKKRKKRIRIVSIAVSLALVLTAGFAVMNRSYFSDDPLSKFDEDTISIWVPVSGDEELREQELAVFNDVKDKFEDSISGVTLQVIPIDRDSYGELFERAMVEGDSPTLFSSEYVFAKKENAASLERLVSSLDSDAFLFLKNYSKWYPNRLQIPLGFSATVIYANTDTAFEDYFNIPEQISSLTELLENPSGEDYLLCIDPQCYGNILSLYSPDMLGGGELKPNSDICEAILYIQKAHKALGVENTLDSLDLLAEGQVTFLLADNSVYREVQTRLPGYYKVVPLSTEHKMYGTFIDEWSISATATDNQQKIGMQLIRFMLSSYVQNHFYLQNDGGVPLNKDVFFSYLDVNREFSFLSESLNQFQFAGQYNNLVEKFGQDINTDIILRDSSEEDIRRYLESYRLITE